MPLAYRTVIELCKIRKKFEINISGENYAPSKTKLTQMGLHNAVLTKFLVVILVTRKCLEKNTTFNRIGNKPGALDLFTLSSRRQNLKTVVYYATWIGRR